MQKIKHIFNTFRKMNVLHEINVLRQNKIVSRKTKLFRARKCFPPAAKQLFFTINFCPVGAGRRGKKDNMRHTLQTKCRKLLEQGTSLHGLVAVTLTSLRAICLIFNCIFFIIFFISFFI